MARKIINIGAIGNDGTGDSIRDSFRSVNDNFRELYSSLGLGEKLTFIGLDDTPESFPNDYENALVVVNDTTDGVVFKKLESGEFNHDTIGMLALDNYGNLSGSCTTSGQGFKMRGRVGDSPMIGAGLFVDNAIGAAVSTGQGEEVIRIAGCHLVVELMRQGLSPENACKKAIERLIKMRGIEKLKDLQVCFIAITKNGEYGSYALQKGFEFAVQSNQINNQIFKSKFLI
jgi:N4-(beta-N-acetylglucosaminyl)-L-asparaginase